jgi:Tripartite tricarboxylate transporter TctB family
MVDGRILTSGLMLALFAGAVAMALTFPPDARFLPLVIGVPGLVMSAVQFVIEVRNKHPKIVPPEVLPRERAMFAWFVLFVGGIIFFGFPYAGPVLIALYLYVSWSEKWYICLGAALLAWGILYGLFEHGLGLPLFEGLVYQWIFG